MTDPASLALIVAALAATGAGAGLVAGLLGIGGGIVIVPALFHVEGLLGVPDAVRMHLAVGTSLAVIVVTSLASVAAHRRRGAVDRAALRDYGPGVLAGVALGTAVAAVVPGEALAAVFAVFALLVALNMAAGRPRWRLGAELPSRPACAALGTLTGAVSTLAGIGGGAMTVAVLTLYAMPIHRAVGTASAVGVLISVPGALGFAAIGWGAAGLPPLSAGYVSLAGLAVIAPATALTAPLGARLAHRLARRPLARIFAVFLGLAAARMIWELAA